MVTESPIVGTGMEVHAARNSGELVINRKAGVVAAVAYP
jgi:DNA-directed RNA polymerase beta subunit